MLALIWCENQAFHQPVEGYQIENVRIFLSRQLGWQPTVWLWLEGCLPWRMPASHISISALTHWWRISPTIKQLVKNQYQNHHLQHIGKHSKSFHFSGARKVWVCVQAADGSAQQGLDLNPLVHLCLSFALLIAFRPNFSSASSHRYWRQLTQALSWVIHL